MDTTVLIIGAGPGGIAMALEFFKAGFTDYVIYERAQEVGGTWRQNTYPGVACDIPGQYYCYSVAPNSTPKNFFATGSELKAYFSDVTRGFAIDPHIRFENEVASLEWCRDHWIATSTAGEQTRHRVVVGAVGRLNKPKLPQFEGVESFEGLIRHSAEWDTRIDLKNKKVGVVGTGSSATQIVSAVAGIASSVDIFQRTPQWIMPFANPPIPEELRQKLRGSPELAREHYRAVEKLVVEIVEAGINPGSRGARQRDDAVRAGLAAVRDATLRRTLTPDYEIGCKRLVISNTYLDTVQRSDVTIVTAPIQALEPSGIRLADGAFRNLDAIILATGFHADNFLGPIHVQGESGATLEEIWEESFLSYKSVALPGMPNLFLINGPYTPGGSLSVLVAIERQAAYVMQLTRRALDEKVKIQPRYDRTTQLLEAVKDQAMRTVWATGGCDSWYLDKNGVPLVSPLTLRQLTDDLTEVTWPDFVVEDLQGA